ncbi:ABC transporter permease [Marimonas sp. MJW-29]|uniref:ABC transporter permease n=1 Tax=Sulfitobacter sediminis TaxID=3234186 RepID=A0ABV3RLC9_9RHOB
MAEKMLAADGRPLKASLNRALRRQKLRALALIAPLLIFILLSFVMPIADMLFRSVENQIVSETLPRTTEALEDWDAADGTIPDEPVFAALYTDIVLANEYKTHTRLGSRLNYELTGISSLFRKSGRGVGRFDTDAYTEFFQKTDPAYADPAQWAAWMADDAVRDALPLTADAYDAWARVLVEVENDDPAAEEPWDFVYAALYRDAANGAALPVAVDVSAVEPVSLKAQFEDIDDDWLDPEVWQTIKIYAPDYTSGYFLNSVDLMKSPDGIEPRPENEQIYITLFIRTMIMSLAIMGMCVLLGYPIAWLLANLPDRTANLLMILVLLPFWTSLLVRTSAWKVLLQQQGVINDTLVWLGVVADGNRLELINNQTGTIIAMTHILLPFMILPLYSVMKTIPPRYLRAAKSLGATNWTAFWRVYFPQSVPGIGAGCILVFILAIGYYITPELVGGTKGVFISNRIAYHISSSLNWGLAAALGTILLAVVLILYWVYDKIVGIDNVKLGG